MLRQEQPLFLFANSQQVLADLGIVPMSAIINTQLIESLAQIILSLKPEEQALLAQKIQWLGIQEPKASFPKASREEVDRFFQNTQRLEPDPHQPTLQEIAQDVQEVRRELWTRS
jgi:hypothetical protein